MKKNKILSAIIAITMLFSMPSLFAGCGEKYYSDSFSDITWPDSNFANKLPEPKSTKGIIESNSENYLKILLGDTSLDQYEEYVSDCKDKGFKLDFDEGLDENKNHYYKAYGNTCYLKLEYHEKDDPSINEPLKNTMIIILSYKPISDESENEKETEKSTENATEKPTVKPTEAPKESSQSANEKSKTNQSQFKNVYNDNLNKYQTLSNTYKQKIETLFSEVGNTYDQYVANSKKVDDWFSNLEADYKALFEETETVTKTYMETVKSKMANSEYDVWDEELDYFYDDYYDGVLDDIYDNIYDGFLDDIYDKYYDEVLDDQPDNVKYSDWSKTRSTFYKNWSNARSKFYKSWSKTRSTVYKAWSNTRSDMYKNS